MAAESLKDKNMPTISANIYCGLQKWVNRASLSWRGRPRMRSRFNSDLSSMSLYKKQTLENMVTLPGTHERVVVHGRSRSNPVTMPESMNFEGDYPKIAKVPTSKQATSRKQSSELSDDSSSQGSFKERSMSVLNQRLSQNLSKSESCLVDGNGSHDRKLRSRSHNLMNIDGRRKSSDTDGSLDSNSSEIDINDNRKPRTSRSLRKTNKRDRSHSTEPRVDLMGANKNELSPRNLEQKSKEIHSRLDRWIEKSSVFQDSRQSSMDSTSSSDDIFYSDSTRLNETQHFRDLQTAIHELVSSCGKHSTNATNGETVETKPKRKISLKDAGSMFNKAVEIDISCLQDKQQGSSSENDSAKSIPKDERKGENYHQEKNDGNGNSFDTMDGHEKIRDVTLVGESSPKVDNHNSVSDIGPDSDITRAMNVIHNHACHDAKTRHSTTHGDINLMDGKIPNGQDQELQNTNSQSKPDQHSSSSHEHNDISPVGKSLEGNAMPVPPKSHKSFHAPSPLATRPGEKPSKADSKVPVFDDDDLTAFAMTCVQHASKKKTSLEKNERESKSDSDEEKKKVDLDFVYLPRNRTVIKSTANPKTTSHEKESLRGAFSDDDNFSSSPSQLRSKAGSTDSLDGYVLFDAVPVKDFDDQKYLSANEDENTNKPEKTPPKSSGLKKFPSMPLFYIPKDFDGNSGGSESRQVRSLGKSLWKRIKSIPRSTENQKTKQSQSSVRSDPFYHGEKGDEDVPKMRPKSNSVGDRNSRLRRRRRLSLDAANVPKPSVTVTQPSEDHTLDDETVVNTPPLPDESQC